MEKQELVLIAQSINDDMRDKKGSVFAPFFIINIYLCNA